jgi:hypothetical protein
MSTQPQIPPNPHHPKTHRLPARRPSMYVEISLQIRLFFAKRTQFLQQQKRRNLLGRKGLPKQTTPGHSKKTNPIEPKRTQFQNGQYEHKCSKNKGLCQRTTNNEQRTLFKTNPIKPKTRALLDPERSRRANQTQSMRAERPPRYAIRNTRYAIRNTKYKPDSPMDTLTKSSYNAP